MSKLPPVLTETEQRAVAQAVLRTINEAVSYYFWHYQAIPILEAKFSKEIVESWKNNEVSSTILAIRAFDEFVSNHRRFDDDLTAINCPF